MSGVRYYMAVKTKTQTPFENFTKAMDHLMTVPHSELKRVLDREKNQKEKERAKASPTSRASKTKE
jgi:hypothetical protein